MKIEEVKANLGLMFIDKYLTEQAKMKRHYMTNELGSFFFYEDECLSVVITITEVPHHKEPLIKIEDLVVDPKYRGQKVWTNFLVFMKEVANLSGSRIGLWSEKHLVESYEKRGFKFIEKKRDYWMEYEPKK